MKSLSAFAIAAAAILAACGDKSGPGSGEKSPRQRADALSSGSMMVYREYWVQGACEDPDLCYSSVDLRMAYTDGTTAQDAGLVPGGNDIGSFVQPAWSPVGLLVSLTLRVPAYPYAFETDSAPGAILAPFRGWNRRENAGNGRNRTESGRSAG